MTRTSRRGAVAALATSLSVLILAAQASAATYTVDSTSDSHDADATVAACADADGKCTLRAAVEQSDASPEADAIALPAGRYVLSLDELTVTTPIRIDGAAAPSTVIDAEGNGRAFSLGPEARLTASGMTITGSLPCGCEPGGGVAMADGSTLDLTDARLTRNQVDTLGGAIANFGGRVNLTRVRVDHNLAGLGGGAIFQQQGELHAVDSRIEANSASAGGAIFAIAFDGTIGPGGVVPGTLDVQGSTLSDNRSRSDGGALLIVNAGGYEPPLSIVDSTLSANSAGHDLAGGGGAISLQEGTLNLVADTFADNEVVESGAGPPLGGTLAATDTSTVTMRDTILADGREAGAPGNCGIDGAGGDPFDSQGNNLETGDSCSLVQASDKPETDPGLGPLADNGGPTPTHALLDGSPAIDAGSNDAGPAADQRGGMRPPPTGSAGAARDIGAYEAHSLADLSVDAASAAPDPAAVGQPLTYSLVVRNNGPDAVSGVTLSDPLPAGATLVSAEGCTGAISCALGTLAPGAVRTLRVVVTPTAAGTLANTAAIGAAGIADPVAGNDSATATTQVNAAPVQPQEPTPSPADDHVVVELRVPKRVTIEEFMNGVVAESVCTGEPCLRRFREHAAINAGATRIAGFNLTVSRGFLPRTATRTRVRLRPCQGGAPRGTRHRRCVRDLRRAARRAGRFRVKVVVSAVDAAGNKDYAKGFVTVTG
jgi:uncharacterized repeat protein (TIGR01451 family)